MRRTDSTHGTIRYVVGLTIAIGSTGIIALALISNRRAAVTVAWPAVVAVALLFFGAERFPIHVPIGTHKHSISFNELPLALGAVYLTPPALAAAALIGSGGALVAHRRQRGVKLAFNLAQIGAQAVVVCAVFAVLRNGAPPTSFRSNVALFVAIVLADALSALLVSTAINLVETQPEPRANRGVLVHGGVENVAKATVAVAIVNLFLHGLSALGVTTVAVAAMLYLAYIRLIPAWHNKTNAVAR
jgi:hypothetical protein